MNHSTTSSAANTVNQPELTWRWRHFQQLELHDLYVIAAARVDIFVVEQHCPYPELDGQDPQAHHLSAWARDGQLWAYLRVLPPTERYPSPSIGRVLTTAAARGLGLGRELMRRGIAACQQCYPGQDILLGAQQHLEPFYASLGFVSNGHRYVEDGIPHVDMRLMATANSPQ